MTPKKVVDEEDEDLDEEETGEEEEEEFQEEEFTCRVCHKKTTVDQGDDMISVCDECSKGLDMDRLWADFDAEKILEENLKSFNLEPYRMKEKPKKGKATGKK